MNNIMDDPKLKCRKCGHEERYTINVNRRCSKCISSDVMLLWPNGATMVDCSTYSITQELASAIELIENLRSQLSVKEKEIQNLTKRGDDMASQLEQLQELVTNLRNSSEKLIAEKGQLTKEIGWLGNELNQKYLLCIDLQDTIKVLSQKNTELTEELSKTQKEPFAANLGKQVLEIGTLVRVISPDGAEKLTGKIDEIVVCNGREIIYNVRYWSDCNGEYRDIDCYESEVEAISVLRDDSYIRIQFGVNNEQCTQQRENSQPPIS